MKGVWEADHDEHNVLKSILESCLPEEYIYLFWQLRPREKPKVYQLSDGDLWLFKR